MQIKNNYNLSKLNTFGINVNAKFFAEVESETDLEELFSLTEFKNSNKIFLGGGSNVLFTKDFDGIVVLNKLKGIKIIGENSETILVRAQSGELWHNLVEFTVNLGYWGLENLSLIPGTVGAAPMQNIGAYGAELKDVLENVEAYEIDGENNKKIFNKAECELGYRDSIFKNKVKGKYFISAVTLKLRKTSEPNLSYKILSDYLEKNNILVRSSKDISDAVAAIRRSKLPDPKLIGNAGSFFKNILVARVELGKLQKSFPDIKFFEEEETSPNLTPDPSPERRGGINIIKIPAGWLIEQCGPANGTSWKGCRFGKVGVHEKQALVLVNYGGATGAEILDLANKIINSVKEKFGLELVPEVNIV